MQRFLHKHEHASIGVESVHSLRGDACPCRIWRDSKVDIMRRLAKPFCRESRPRSSNLLLSVKVVPIKLPRSSQNAVNPNGEGAVSKTVGPKGLAGSTPADSVCRSDAIGRHACLKSRNFRVRLPVPTFLSKENNEF